MGLLGTKGLFKDLTGLALNQENAASALKTVMTAAQNYASEGAALAQQKYLAGSLDRNLDLIKRALARKQISKEQAQKMTEDLFRGALGIKKNDGQAVTEHPAVKKTMDRVTSSKNGEMRLTRPGGSVELTSGSGVTANGVDVAVKPPVTLARQANDNGCWAAAGTMMTNWKAGTTRTVEDVLDGLGGNWRALYTANTALGTGELRAFNGALGLTEEGPASYSLEGLARLLSSHGPLIVIHDDTSPTNQHVHAMVVTEMHGDGTPDGTKVTLLDPGSATPATETFTEFQQRLEARESVDVGVGIFHW
jgi:hypothetical protein